MANGITRYDKPAQQQLMNTYVPLPYKELMMAGAAQQKQLDAVEQARIKLGEQEFYNLQADDPKAQAYRQRMDRDIDEIADLYGTNLSKARNRVRQLARQYRKDFGQSGEVGAMQAAYDKRAAWEKYADAEIKAGRMDPLQKSTMMAAFDENYTTQGGIGQADRYGRYQSYGTEDAATFVNPTEWADKYGKGFMANVNAFADVSFSNYDANGNPQYIFKKKGTNEELTEEEIEAGLQQYFKGDPQLQNYLRQGRQYGYADLGNFIAAVEGAKIKYGYEKDTYDESISGDPHWQYKSDKIAEEEATPTIDRPGGETFLFSEYQSGEQIFQNTKDLYTQMANLEGKIGEAEILYDSYLTTDEEGNKVVRPEMQLEAAELFKKIQGAKRKHQTAQTEYNKQMDIVNHTLFDKLGGVNNPYGIEMPEDIVEVSQDKKSIIVQDKTDILGWEDASGELITQYEEDIMAEYGTTDPEQLAAMGITPRYNNKVVGFDGTSFDDNVRVAIGNTFDEMTTNSYKSQSYPMIAVGQFDRETSAFDSKSPGGSKENVQNLHQNIQTHPESYDVSWIDPTTGGLTKIEGSSLGQLLTLGADDIEQKMVKVEANDDYTDEQKARMLKELEVQKVIANKAAFDEGFTLTGIFGDDKSTLEYSTPTGQKVYISSNDKQHKDLVTGVARNMEKTGGLHEKMMRLRMENPQKAKQARNIRQTFAGHTASETDKGTGIASESIHVGFEYETKNGKIKAVPVYKHFVKQGNANQIHTWLSTDESIKDDPTPGYNSYIISMDEIENEVLLTIDDYLSNF